MQIKTSIRTKVTLGYIIIITIPLILLSFYFYQSISSAVISKYVNSRQHILTQNINNINHTLSKIEETSTYFQTNVVLTEYLNNYYKKTAEKVYQFNKYISPTFTYAHMINSEIKNICVYTYKDLFEPNDYLINIKKLTNYSTIEKDIKIHPNGLWTLNEATNHLIFYKELTTEDSSLTPLGLLEITIDLQHILSLTEADSQHTLLFHDSRILRSSDSDDAHKIFSDYTKKASQGYFSSVYIFDKSIINAIYMESLGIGLLIIEPFDNIFNIKFIILLVALLLFGFLSVIYYFTSFSISNRITALTRHIKRSKIDKLKPFSATSKNTDEINLLIHTYNNLIAEVDFLINKDYKMQLLHQETKYYALQSQINPHFIYNTLEVIRMMAEMNNDTSTADICQEFGQYIRYCFSINKKEVLIKDEIDNIERYLRIHKLRMQDRFEFEVHYDDAIMTIKFPWFILQPLVENSILHGISHVGRVGIIRVECHRLDDVLHITINDNGKGLSIEKVCAINASLDDIRNGTSPQFNQGSIGLTNIYQRLLLFYGKAANMWIESTENHYTTIAVNIPLDESIELKIRSEADVKNTYCG